MIHAFAGQLAGLLCIAQSYVYIRSIIRGESKPSRSANAIWFLVGMISLLSYLAAGATTTRWLSLSLFCSTTIVFTLSLRRGVGGLKRLDIICLGIAVGAICIWRLSHNPDLAVFACMTASLIAYVPVIRKTYLNPETENKTSWVIYCFACICNVIALSTLKPAIAAPVLMGLFCDLSVLYCLYHHSVATYHIGFSHWAYAPVPVEQHSHRHLR